jgi:hypothetical protein
VKKPLLILLVLLSTSLARSSSAQAPAGRSHPSQVVFVGILDDAKEEVLNWTPGVAKDRLIRPAFEKTSAGWRNADFSGLPKQMSWTVAFDGKCTGQVTSANPRGVPGPRVQVLTRYQFIVSSPNKIPSVGSPSERFAPMGLGPTKGRRPLVVISKPNCSDPDGWKRSERLPDEIASSVRKEFRREFPNINRCKDEEITVKNWKFPDSALSFPVVYASNKNSFLVRASLDAGDCGYVDDPGDPLSDPWFFVSADGRAKHFGSFLTLIDAGDYDAGGRSELVFMLNQPEDTDGFVLFDADLKEQATLIWTYH